MSNRRVTFKMLDKEKRRRLRNCGVYFAVLLLGVLIGLIPFLIQYAKDTQADREVLREFVHQNITDALKQLTKLQNKVNKLSAEQKPSALAVTSKSMKTIVQKRASSIGNTNMNLECNGEIAIEKLKLNNIAAFPKDVKRFDEYCKTNLVSDKFERRCAVSMNLVLGITLISTELTEIEYSCEETVTK